MFLYVSIAIILVAKFGVYSFYAKYLNQWFGKSHNIFRIAAIRIGLSIIFTAANTLLATQVLFQKAGSQELLPLLLAFLLGALAWYILLRLFYSSDHNSLFIKALGIGTLVSAALGLASGFLALLGLLSEVNFC